MQGEKLFWETYDNLIVHKEQKMLQVEQLFQNVLMSPRLGASLFASLLYARRLFVRL